MDYSKMKIFKGLTDSEIANLLKNLDCHIREFGKGEYIFRRAEISNDFYFLIEGEIIVFQIDAMGNRFIFQKIDAGTGFGEIYAYLNEPYDFDGMCEADSKIFIIKDFRKLFDAPNNEKFLKNYINFISHKCLNLSRKNQITSQKSLRQKIGKFLVERAKDNTVSLDMTREDLADYLSTTRPSLSRELSKMAVDGIISLDGKDVKIIDIEKLKEIL